MLYKFQSSPPLERTGGLKFCILFNSYEIADSLQLVGVTDSLWDSGDEINLGFFNGTDREKNLFKSIAASWLDEANIDFKYVNDISQACIRVQFQESSIGSSFLGKSALNVPSNLPTVTVPSFRDIDSFKQGILHEVGHVLGLVHEHQSPIADIPWNIETVYRAMRFSGYSDELTNQNILNRYDSTRTQFSQFDPNSIMIYAIPKEFVTDENFVVKANSELSMVDREFIKKLYP